MPHSDAHSHRTAYYLDGPSLFLALAAAVSALALCVLIGIQREARAAAAARGQRPAEILQYGERLPPFLLPTTDGGSLDSRHLGKQWTLLVFAATWCTPCGRELQALARASQQLRPYVAIRPIVEGETGPLAPRVVAAGYAQRNRLPFEMAIDSDKTAGKRCGAARGLPYSVLVDPQGTIRLTDSGSWPTPAGSTKLVEGLISFFTGSPAASQPFLRWRQIKPVIDQPVTLVDGRRTSLAELSRANTLVMTFLTGGDPLEGARIQAIRRCAHSPGVCCLFVLSGPGARPRALGHGDGLLVAEQDTGRLFAACAVRRGPVSIILHHGRVVIREEIAQPSGEAFENELAYAVFLSDPATVYRATEAMSGPARLVKGDHPDDDPTH